MKKYLYLLAAVTGMFLGSCSSDDDVEIDETFEVNVSVSLNNFFQSYDFYDTKHDINIADKYRVFNSERNLYIQVRTLFYDSDGYLVDSLLTYSTNTNQVTKSIRLEEGSYTAVTTLAFANKTTGDDASWWELAGKDKLSTAVLYTKNRYNMHCIMSYDAQTFNVTPGKSATVTFNPAPVGALGYLYFQNFQYVSESSYGQVADNGMRQLCVYSRNIADGYQLNPNSYNKYIYWDDGGSNWWYYLSENLRPQDFSSDWTFFKTNLYDFFYILAPSVNIEFGYTMDGEDTFTGYGNANYNIVSGKTYLAYWDNFQIGNPYFGIADNNHWNSYSTSSSSAKMRLTKLEK